MTLEWYGEQEHEHQSEKISIVGEERKKLAKELIINGVSNTRNILILENGDFKDLLEIF